MTPIAAMVKELLEKGVAHEAIVIAIEGAERALSGVVSTGSPVDIAAEKRRAYDRERKAREREIHRTSTGIPRTSENASLSKEEKKEEIKEERGAARRNVRGHRLPDHWQPETDDWNEAIAKIGQPAASDELSKFRDHWKQQPGSRGVKLDWNAAWRNWIRRAAEYRGGTNGHSHRGAQQHRPAKSDFFAGIASVAADIAGHSEAPRPAGEEIPLGRINIDG